MSLSFVIPEFNIGGAGTPPLQFFRRGFNLNGSSGGGGWTDIILHGNTALTLVNAKANGLNYLKLFGGTEQRNLPAGHTQLEYVYMTSGSYIKIEDLLISAGYKIEYEFQTTTLGSSLRNYLGGRASGVSAGGGFRLSKLASGGTTLNRVVLYGFETGTEFYDPTAQFQPNTRYKYTYDNGVCTLESGGSVISTQTFAITDNTSTKWGINSYVSNNDYWQTDSADGVFGYSLKVWNSQGELVMDLVPDLTSSNVVCYYDMVTGNIREASGGTFEAGTIAPTPSTPVNIISNNGAIKYSANMANVNEQTALVGYYISSSGVVTADANNWIYQDYIPVKPSTTYTLTISTPVYYVTISEYSTADDAGFIRRNTGSTGGNTTLTITTRSTARYIRFGANIDSSDVTLNKILAINWMLNVGNTMAYQPYVEGGIYTDGTVETVAIKNNIFTLVGATYDETIGGTGTPSSSPNNGYSDYLAVTGGDVYNFSDRGLSGVALYDQNKVFKSRPSVSAGDYTIPADIAYIRVNFRQPIMNNISITHTNYTATAEMLLAIGSYQDIQNITNGHITRNVGIKVLDGTETWIKASSSDTSGNNVYYMSFDSKDTGNSKPMLCTHFKYVGSASYTTLASGQFLSNSANTSVYFDGLDITTRENWKAYIAQLFANGTPVIVVYPLAEPTIETVAHQHLGIQAGSNVVEITQASIDNLGLEVSYKGKEGE